ncbi:NUDIX domain-containing protein [Bacillus sp. S3]|uniref:NUDIX hydrolase n=1 Tax=Bacillus sp. S3 TaxID=486398 RepID=UPI001188537A|nr:NUDIX domain-containing protein [Bacillus sp. S3]QCJ41290.1 NUDIX domain-containing protein [Bacillus sp. S3]
MENELVRVFDNQRKPIGTATRAEVHRQGLWHESFHCWIVSREQEINYLYLQRRCGLKKDHPNLFDITSAGHLLADETAADGIREIKEELGIDVSFTELMPLGIINYCVNHEDLIDNELAHTFLYKKNLDFDVFSLQKEEVSGIIKVKFTDFIDLWSGEKHEINIIGFEINNNGEKLFFDRMAGKQEFVPHGISFYKKIIQLIKEKLNESVS